MAGTSPSWGSPQSWTATRQNPAPDLATSKHTLTAPASTLAPSPLEPAWTLLSLPPPHPRVPATHGFTCKPLPGEGCGRGFWALGTQTQGPGHQSSQQGGGAPHLRGTNVHYHPVSFRDRESKLPQGWGAPPPSLPLFPHLHITLRRCRGREGRRALQSVLPCCVWGSLRVTVSCPCPGTIGGLWKNKLAGFGRLEGGGRPRAGPVWLLAERQRRSELARTCFTPRPARSPRSPCLS